MQPVDTGQVVGSDRSVGGTAGGTTADDRASTGFRLDPDVGVTGFVRRSAATKGET